MDPKELARMDMFYSLLRALNEAGISISFEQLMETRIDQALVQWSAAGIRFERKSTKVLK